MKKRLVTASLGAPYLLWAGIFIIVPLAMVCWYAFTDGNGAFTLDNIRQLHDYRQIIVISLWYSVLATAICLVLGYPFAYFASRTSARHQRTIMLLVMLPMLINLLILTYSWMNILENNGLLNKLLAIFGLGPYTFLGTSGAVVLGMVYNYLPYMILPVYSVMTKMDPALLDAAADLGAGTWAKLRRVILPLSLPGVISGVLMVFVPSISTFYISQKLGNGRINLIGDVIERQVQANYNYNLGAALSLLLMVIVFVSMAIVRKRLGDEGGETLLL